MKPQLLLIITTMRTGSSMLCDMLERTGEFNFGPIGFSYELFNINDSGIKNVDEFVKKNKINAIKISSHELFEQILNFPFNKYDIKVIISNRKNHEEQAKSIDYAMQTKVYHHTKDYQPTPIIKNYIPKVKFKILNNIYRDEWFNLAWTQHHEYPFEIIDYEDIIRDPLNTVNIILDLCGKPRVQHVKTDYKKVR